MNRRVLIRAGLGYGLLAPYTTRCALAFDRNEPTWVPAEQPPISEPVDPPSLLSGLIESKQVETAWKLIESNRVQVSIKNNTAKRINLQIDPGSILTHEKSSWLVGGPTRYVGQFGGHFHFQQLDGKPVAATLPVPAARKVEIILPVLELHSPVYDKFQVVDQLKIQMVRDWTKDPKIASNLIFLSSVGTSLSVGQALAWCMTDQLKSADLTKHKVEGQTFNTFEQQSVNRFLKIQKPLAADVSMEQTIAELEKNKIAVQVTAYGKKRIAGQKMLVEMLPEHRLMGLPIHEISTTINKQSDDSVLKLDLHVDAELRPGFYAVDASIATRTGIDGTYVKIARTRFPLNNSIDADTLLDWLEIQMASSIAKLVRTGQAGMSSRFRLENRSVLNLSAVEVLTNSNSEDPATWTLDNMGVAPRNRTIVSIPSDTAKAVHVRFSAI